MKRATLSSLEPDELIAIVLAHPHAGRHIVNLLEGEAGTGRLASYSVVFHGRTVCLRIPGVADQETRPSVHLLVWDEDHRHPWKVDALRLPRDSAELKLLAMAAAGGRREVSGDAEGQLTSKAA
jgi:hypothetical protein